MKGPTFLQCLLTVHEKEYSSFKEAVQERGLLETDQGIIECSDEASIFQMSRTFRRLFATLLAHCEPTNVRNLWTLIYCLKTIIKKITSHWKFKFRAHLMT